MATLTSVASSDWRGVREIAGRDAAESAWRFGTRLHPKTWGISGHCPHIRTPFATLLFDIVCAGG